MQSQFSHETRQETKLRKKDEGMDWLQSQSEEKEGLI